MVRGALQAVWADAASAAPPGFAASSPSFGSRRSTVAAGLGLDLRLPRPTAAASGDFLACGRRPSPLRTAFVDGTRQAGGVLPPQPPQAPQAEESIDPNFVPVPGGPQQPPRKPNCLGDPLASHGLSDVHVSSDVFSDGDMETELDWDVPDKDIVELPESEKVGCKHPFLKFARKSEVLDSTDITCPSWISKHSLSFPGSLCTKENYVPGVPPWFHPSFRFKKPLHRVRIRLGPEGKEPTWDVSYGGGPGGPTQVWNTAVPVGGLKPLFPYFCDPMHQSSRWTLRITDAERYRAPKFDELLTLKMVPVQKGPGNEPRPITELQKGSEDGAVRSLAEGEVPDDIDFETGERLKSFL